MYGTYQRLDITVWASNREVIKAATKKLKNWRNPNEREARKKFYKLMLEYHQKEQDMCREWRL